jgi:hypothetical protein
MSGYSRENGASDTLGAIFLVSVVVLGITIAGVAIFSSPRPQKLPELDVTVANTTTTVFLTHNGGDTLRAGEYRILVDGKDQTINFLNNGVAAGDWSAGNTLVYTPSGGKIPTSYQIVYTGIGNSQVILSVSG